MRIRRCPSFWHARPNKDLCSTSRQYFIRASHGWCDYSLSGRGTRKSSSASRLSQCARSLLPPRFALRSADVHLIGRQSRLAACALDPCTIATNSSRSHLVRASRVDVRVDNQGIHPAPNTLHSRHGTRACRMLRHRLAGCTWGRTSCKSRHIQIARIAQIERLRGGAEKLALRPLYFQQAVCEQVRVRGVNQRPQISRRTRYRAAVGGRR